LTTRRRPGRVQHPQQRPETKRRGRGTLSSAIALAATLAAALGLAFGLGAVRDGDSGPAFRPGLLAPSDPGPVHVHGLGINEIDGSLYIATHTGTWRVARGEKKASRVGDSYQDTMGFTVVGPNRFLGSGHPDVRDARERNLPPLLGLIESADAGKTWRPVSLLGEADFHVLRAVARRVYGFDATNNRLMVSRDGGGSWRQYQPPAPLIDLVVDPRNPNHVVASSERGLHESGNAGRTWRQLGNEVGLLAWPSSGRLYLVDRGGRAHVQDGFTERWRGVGEIGGAPAALLARSEAELYVALHDGTIKRSTDGGASWTVRSRP
jgi:hypothetical protein